MEPLRSHMNFFHHISACPTGLGQAGVYFMMNKIHVCFISENK